ncbi:NUDIX hydrolase [Streptomyces platensis]|uniref:NUDIX domain-containing protein n=1 Tax=Streptomyces platensis TaxID=58346 RepID=UPI0030E35550
MTWTQVSTRLLHPGRFISLRQDTVTGPDGVRGTYDHVEVEDGVRVVAIDGQGYVPLVEDHFYLQQQRLLHLPGGGTGGQNPSQAALRELQEETGLHADDVDPLGVIDPLPGVTAARTHLYLATSLRLGTVNREPTESGMRVHRMTLGEAVEAVRAGRVSEAGSVTALLLAELRLR